MELDQVFVDLDSVRWAEVEHAYGEAEDLPGILRSLAGDEDQAREALDELWSSVLHQGTVYTATAEAVPFLARIAAAGVRTAEMLVLLGGIAESDDEFELPVPGACRAAVREQLPLILPLIGAGEAEVRRAAVWAAGRTGAAGALPALRRRWGHRPETPGVRAELLAALTHVDPAGTTGIAAAAMAPGEPPEVRLIAVMAQLDARVPWSAAHHDTMVELLPAAPRVAGRFSMRRSEPLHYAVDALLWRDTDEDRTAAHRLLEAALRLPDPEARGEALWVAEHACTISRSAPARLAPAVLALLADPSFTPDAALLPLLDELGPHALPAAPALARLAAQGGDFADRLLGALARIAPEQLIPLLARDPADRDRALAALTRLPGRPGTAVPVPYAPELLNAIRIRLTEIVHTEEADPSEIVRLAALPAAWGHRAAAALPELTAAFHRFPAQVARVLAEVCPPESREDIARALRGAAGSGEPAARFAAAGALHTLTGEPDPLVRVVQDVLRDRVDTEPEMLTAAGELGPRGMVLVPALRAALTPPGTWRSNPVMETDTAAALALWRLTGDAEEPVRVLAGVLAEAAEGRYRDGPIAGAVRAAARIGPAARPLAPALESLLDRPDHAPAAILALRDIGRALDPSRAAGLLLLSAECQADPITALEALRGLGPGVLTREHLGRLAVLAESDLRVVTRPLLGPPGGISPDERLRARAREVLDSEGAGEAAAPAGAP
ncbi:hypothetical protein [Streptomyces sp. CAU 1734]|uniref:hypothetical protein n=1 Tax=Streptomyces sp. CAU 1734 TaxID=3140360 RepID=UPI0032604BF1